MAKYWKVVLLIILTGLSIILSTALFALQMMLKQRKQAYKIYRDRKIKEIERSGGTSETWSNTVKVSTAMDSLTEINMRHGKFSHGATNEIAVSADAHLSLALRGIPFLMNADEENMQASALRPQLLFADSRESGNDDDENSSSSSSSSNDKNGDASASKSSSKGDAGGSTVKEEGDIKYKSDKKNRKRSSSSGQYKSVWALIKSYVFQDSNSESPTNNQSFNNTNTNAQSMDKLEMERKAMYHLEKAAELGNHQAQNMLANILASGILPFEDHPSLRTSGGKSKAKELLNVQADFAEGGEQLARAIILWHLSAMEGNIEAAMSLGYRNYVSATSGNEKFGLISEESLVSVDGVTFDTKGKMTESGKGIDATTSSRVHSSSASAHYGVLGTCESSLAYYEAAANAIMDEMESSPLRGKVPPARDYHKLAEIHQRGASSILAYHNKPDELDEAIKYYQMRAKNPQQPDIHAAYKVANMYHYGLRGVKQDMTKALEYYTIAADLNSWEAAGQAGKFHLWGIGVGGQERNLKKAYNYFQLGTPGGLEGCQRRFRKKSTMKEKSADDDGLAWDHTVNEVYNCDHPCLNGKGLLHLYGMPMMVSVNVTRAIEYFELAKNLGNNDATYNLAMMRLGWMNPFYSTSFDYNRKDLDFIATRASSKDFVLGFELLKRADSMGHMQAKHRLAMLYSKGVSFDGVVVIKKNCSKALKLYMDLAEQGTTNTKRMRTAYKQYMDGDYESSLRNYLAAAETGSVEAQVNAAFMLEQGFCLGMNRLKCMKASVRMWRAAARQGDEEACLRVGDFYYYGHLRENTDSDISDTMSQRDVEYSSSPFPWTRYILYPEDLLVMAKKYTIKATRWVLSRSSGTRKNETLDRLEREGFCSNNDQSCVDKDRIAVPQPDKEQQDHFELAARYYRKAADDHGSARANFNLGFMHEWGLGLTQDFPLAKRFYDVAASAKNKEGEIAVQIALSMMRVHEMFVRAGLSIEKWLLQRLASPSKSSKDYDEVQVQYHVLTNGHKTATDILMYHIFNADTALILLLALILSALVQNIQYRRLR